MLIGVCVIIGVFVLEVNTPRQLAVAGELLVFLKRSKERRNQRMARWKLVLQNQSYFKLLILSLH